MIGDVSDKILDDMRLIGAQHSPMISNIPPYPRPDPSRVMDILNQQAYQLDTLVKRIDNLEADNAVLKEIIEELENG